jgi:predicted peptidase
MRMSAAAAVAIVVLALAVPGCAALEPRERVQTGQFAQSFSPPGSAEASCRYLIYVPEQYNDSRRRWPLVLFLHGAGERGDDLEVVKKNGPPKLIAEGRQFPCIIVSPQCPLDAWGPAQVPTLEALLDDVESRYSIDKHRVYLTGLSMGGFGTWALAFDQPDRFAALAPVCGRGNPTKAALVAHVPTWVFHGAKDTTVPPSASQEMVDALKAAGGDPKFTLYPDAGHDSWTATYANPEFWDWLLAQRRGAKDRD